MSFIDDPELRAKVLSLAAQADRGQGRSLDELIASDGSVRGQEAQRLRNFYTSECMEPGRDLDFYGRLLFMGNLEAVKDDFHNRVTSHRSSSSSDEEARKKAADELYSLKWGPTRVPIYQLLYFAGAIYPENRQKQLQVMRWLIDEAKVSVDGRDLLGSTAIHLTLSTKPGFDPEIAQILYDGGADVNLRNRPGANAAHESTMILEPNIVEKGQTAAKAVDWFLTHGGNLDIKDNNGGTARSNINLLRKMPKQYQKTFAPLYSVVERADKRRKELGDTCCTLCGTVPNGAAKLLFCSRCKVARYCAPPKTCQKLDWPNHKEPCAKVAKALDTANPPKRAMK